MKTPDDFSVDNVYSYQSPEDLKKYYNDWAHQYDDYTVQVHYVLGQYIAMHASKSMPHTTVSVLDIGCGTGIVGENIFSRRPSSLIDGIDISKKMINLAKLKSTPDGSLCYRKFYCQDLTTQSNIIKEQYDFLVSAGTFTLGHLGSDDLLYMIKYLTNGGKAIVSVKGDHFESDNFSVKIYKAISEGLIKDLLIHETNAYNSNFNALNKVIEFTKI
jgi:predicted TPR repeat methyltransferase